MGEEASGATRQREREREREQTREKIEEDGWGLAVSEQEVMAHGWHETDREGLETRAGTRRGEGESGGTQETDRRGEGAAEFAEARRGRRAPKEEGGEGGLALQHPSREQG